MSLQELIFPPSWDQVLSHTSVFPVRFLPDSPHLPQSPLNIPSDFWIKYDLILFAFLGVLGGKHNFVCYFKQIIANIKVFFKNKTNHFFSFNALLVGIAFSVLFTCVRFLRLFCSSVIMKLQVNNISFAWLLIWPLIKSCEITKNFQ